MAVLSPNGIRMTYICNVQIKDKGEGKGKVQTVTCHERQGGGVEVLLLFFLTLVLDGSGVNATPRLLYPIEREPVPIEQQGRSGRVRKILSPLGFDP
jgi:hypothetical protein